MPFVPVEKVLGVMLWTETNSLKGLNLRVMNIHQRLSLIGPLFAREKPIGEAGAGVRRYL